MNKKNVSNKYQIFIRYKLSNIRQIGNLFGVLQKNLLNTTYYFNFQFACSTYMTTPLNNVKLQINIAETCTTVLIPYVHFPPEIECTKRFQQREHIRFRCNVYKRNYLQVLALSGEMGFTTDPVTDLVQMKMYVSWKITRAARFGINMLCSCPEKQKRSPIKN